MGLLFVEGIEEVEEEEICIPGIGWVALFTKEARDYLENREADELEDEKDKFRKGFYSSSTIEPGFDSEAAIEAFLLENPDGMEHIPQGATYFGQPDSNEADYEVVALQCRTACYWESF